MLIIVCAVLNHFRGVRTALLSPRPTFHNLQLSISMARARLSLVLNLQICMIKSATSVSTKCQTEDDDDEDKKEERKKPIEIINREGDLPGRSFPPSRSFAAVVGYFLEKCDVQLEERNRVYPDAKSSQRTSHCRSCRSDQFD